MEEKKIGRTLETRDTKGESDGVKKKKFERKEN